MEYHIISFEEFKEDCRHLAAVLALKKPLNVFGIMRGGMVVALHIAHELGIPASSVYPLYPTRRGNDQVCAPVKIPRGTDIVIDDIIDTGQTEQELASSWPGLQFAVLYSKTTDHPSKIEPKTIIGRFINSEDYVVLPHEVLPTDSERF